MGNKISSPSYVRFDTKKIEETGLDTYAQLACVTRGASIEYTSDEFFGKAENLLKQETVDGVCDQEGTSDGWQVRRHLNTASVLIKLGCTGTLSGIDIDTTGFVDSAPCNVFVEGHVECEKEEKWVVLLPNVSIEANSHNFFKIQHDPRIYSHIKLVNSPGGGIARLRCYGQVVPIWKDLTQQYNLASANLGAQVVHWTDEDYANKPNILLDGGKTLSEGWITPRSRGDDRNDYVVIQLATTGIVEVIKVDTSAFAGNNPQFVQIEGCQNTEVDPYRDPGVQWFELLNKTACMPDNNVSYFITCGLPVSHIKLSLFPDGGLQQIQILGKPYNNGQCTVTTEENRAVLEEKERIERIEQQLDNQITKDIDDLLLPTQPLSQEKKAISTKRKPVGSVRNPVSKRPAYEQISTKSTRGIKRNRSK